jgi:hypothetical protein
VERDVRNPRKVRGMTPGLLSTFRDAGLVRLGQAMPRKHVEPLRTHVVKELARLRIWSSGKTLSPSFRQAPPFQQITKLSGMIRHDDLLARLIDEHTLATIASLAGARLVPTQGQFLVSLPRQGDWTLDRLNWHTDIAAAGHRQVPGIQAFVLLDDVQPRGGATLAITGSHRLADQREPYRRIREVLRGSGDRDAELQRMHLSMVEMAGRAGDVYLMDMRLLHTPSINATGKLRIMATARCLPGAHAPA